MANHGSMEGDRGGRESYYVQYWLFGWLERPHPQSAGTTKSQRRVGSPFRWVAAAILPVRAAVRPGVVPAREETEGRGRGGDMVDVNNIQG